MREKMENDSKREKGGEKRNGDVACNFSSLLWKQQSIDWSNSSEARIIQHALKHQIRTIIKKKSGRRIND